MQMAFIYTNKAAYDSKKCCVITIMISVNYDYQN